MEADEQRLDKQKNGSISVGKGDCLCTGDEVIHDFEVPQHCEI